jgi:DNA-binding IclR family transcriptional regulator
MPKKDSYYSSTLEKGLKVLAAFGPQTPEFTLSQLARHLGLNKTTTYRMVNTLVELGYLHREPQGKLLRPGFQALCLANDLLRSSDVVDMIKPLIDEVHRRYNITVDAALYQPDALIIAYRREANETLTYRLPTMHRELHSTSLGKAFLAYQPREKMLAILDRVPRTRRTDKTITERQAVLDELEATRRRGYAKSDEEYVPGLITLGAPLIKPDTDQAVGAISFDFSGAQNQLEEVERQYAGIIVDLAGRLSKILPVF